MKYIALLRGINVGGNKKVPMGDLTKAFELVGCENVQTILNTGNVIFDSPVSGNSLQTKLEETLRKAFGFEIPVILRSISDIQKLIEANPFKGITVTPQTRLYVTFLSEPTQSFLPIPYGSPENDFKIINVTSGEVCSVLTVSPKKRTTDAMKILENEFGSKITTRNWNTIARIFKNTPLARMQTII